jgi:hypothetical protein
MSAHELIRQLATETGAGDLALNAQGLARLGFDDTVFVDLEWAEHDRVLHLSSVLGPMPAAGREAFGLRLLSANLLGLDTDGATLAVDADTDEVLLCTRIEPDSASFAQFKATLERLLATAERLRPDLFGAAAPGVEPATRATAAGADLAAFLMRV